MSSFARVYGLSGFFPNDGAYLHELNFIQSLTVFSFVGLLVSKLRKLVIRLQTHAGYLKDHAKYSNHKRMLDSTIRRAIVEDADEIVRLISSGAKEGAFPAESLSIEQQQGLSVTFKDAILRGIGERDLWIGGKATVPIDIWVSVLNGNIAGFILVLGVNGNNGIERELHGIVVSPNYRGIGIGSAMVDFFCSHYNKRLLYASCKPGSTMKSMLEKRGFKSVVNNISQQIVVFSDYFLLARMS